MLSERGMPSSRPWVLENARAESANVLVRIVSENGVKYFGESKAKSDFLTPRATAGVRKLPPKAPDCRREASVDSLKPVMPGLPRTGTDLSDAEYWSDRCGPSLESQQMVIQGAPIRTIACS